MHLYQPFVVLSGDTNEIKATDRLVDDLKSKHYSFLRGEGRYDSKAESCVVVFSNIYEPLLEIAKNYNQECILFVNARREAELIYLDHRPPRYLGRWQKATPNKSEGYTYVPGKGTFVTRKIGKSS